MFDREGLHDPIKSRFEVESTTQLFIKRFTRTEWEKLDFVVDGFGYGVTMQKILEEKFNIILEEDRRDVSKEIR